MLPIYLGLLDLQEDKELFTMIYTTYKQPMMQAAMKVIGDRDLAEDAVQEAFLDIVRHFEKVQKYDERHLRGYVLLVSHSKAVNICRKREHDVYIEDYPDTFSNDDELNWGEPAETILDGIPEPYREVLLWTGLKYTPEEIAEQLGENKWTIYKRLERGKKILQRKLNTEGK